MIEYIGPVEFIEFIGGGGIDPALLVTNGGETVTDGGEDVTNGLE